MACRSGLCALVLALSGCSGPRSPQPPQSSAPPQVVTPAPPAVSSAPTVDTTQWDHVSDPSNWALLSRQRPPDDFVDFHRESKTFAVGEFDEVRAYRFGFDRWAPLYAGVDQDVGCNNLRAVAADGTLCPSVVQPGKNVDVEVGTELVHRFDAPRIREDLEIMCQAEYHHAFVFYRKGVPVGELLVSFDCPRWQAAPGFEEHYPFGPQHPEAWLRDLCRSLDLSFCDPSSKKERRTQAAWLDANGDPTSATFQLLARAVPVSKSQRLRDLDEQDVLALCVWNTQHLAFLMQPLTKEEGGGPQHPTKPSHWVRPLNWKACVEKFPSCTATVDELVPCMDAAQTGDPFFLGDETKTCGKVSHCLWGFEFHDDG